ncbi:fungal-specific transcription factor domain-containing protein [Lipomyces kononenkoae]
MDCCTIKTPPPNDTTTSITDIRKLDNTLDEPLPMKGEACLSQSREESRRVEQGLDESYLGGSSNLLFSHAAKVQLRESGQDKTSNTRDAVDYKISISELAEPVDTASPTDCTDVEFEHTKRLPNVTDQVVGSSRLWISEPTLSEIDPKILALPSKALAKQLVGWYFDNASPTYRILHRPAVEHWIECGFHADDAGFDVDDYETNWLDVRATPSNVKTASIVEERSIKRDLLMKDRSINALIFSVWALGCQYPVGVLPYSKQKRMLQRKAEQFYLIAQNELKMMQSLVDRLTTLQAQFIMCQYLLTTSRVKSSWDLLASVKTMAYNLDLNRRNFGHWAAASSTKYNDKLYVELRKRAFWAIYTLDSYMCTMLGKTLMFAEEDITVGFPEPYADGGEVVDVTAKPSLVCTPIAHAKLSKVVRLALRRLYSDVHPNNQEDIIDELGKMVRDWVEELPSFLRVGSAQELTLPYSRQLDVVRLAHAHVLILIYRPSLNITQGARMEESTQFCANVTSDRRQQKQQEICLEAALSVARIRWLKGVSGSYWFIAYICFCAVTVMFVFVAQHPNSSRRSEILQCAKKLCSTERRLATQSEMAKRYVLALRVSVIVLCLYIVLNHIDDKQELWRQVRKPLVKLESAEQQHVGLEKTGDWTRLRSLDENSPPTPIEADISPLAGLLDNHQSYESVSLPTEWQELDMDTEEDGSMPDCARTSISDRLKQLNLPVPFEQEPEPMPPGYTGNLRLTDFGPVSFSDKSDIGVGYEYVAMKGVGHNEDFRLFEDDSVMFGNILGNLAQSFQEFDSTASAGLGMFQPAKLK